MCILVRTHWLWTAFLEQDCLSPWTSATQRTEQWGAVFSLNEAWSSDAPATWTRLKNTAALQEPDSRPQAYASYDSVCEKHPEQTDPKRRRKQVSGHHGLGDGAGSDCSLTGGGGDKHAGLSSDGRTSSWIHQNLLNCTLWRDEFYVCE